MFYIGRIYEGLRDALAPLGNVDTKHAIETIKSPKKIKKLLLNDDKRANILLMDAETREMKFIGGAMYSNIVFNPDMGKGWGTWPGAKWKLEGETVFIVDPLIPYALGVNPEAYTYEPMNDPNYDKLKKSLGLPSTMIRTTSDVLGQAAMEGFLSAFMDNKGSVIYMIFGMLLASTVWFCIMLLLGLLMVIL